MYIFNYIDEKGNTQVGKSIKEPDMSYGFGVVTPIFIAEGPDNLFRNAWKIVDNQLVTDFLIAKEITHEKRRCKREEQFKPFDEIISKQIPGNDTTVAESERQSIRDMDDVLQIVINDASTEEDLRTIIINDSL